MKNFNLNDILDVLERKYLHDVYYIEASLTLIALNPFKNVDYLYSKGLIEFYYNSYASDPKIPLLATNGDINKIKCLKNETILLNNLNLNTDSTKPNESTLIKSPNKPHIFKYASIAWRNLSDHFNNICLNCEKNQTIVVSGVSGSGKTRTISYIVYYFTHILNSNRVKSIENILLLANVILESFGNAKTIHNDNSSRFGKYIQLNFSNKKSLYNVKIRTYLLEKTRVLNEIKSERNFHIFYQLIGGTNEIQKTSWRINSSLVRRFMKENTANDSVRWQILQNAFSQLRIRNTEQMYQIVIAVAHLNSCKFVYENSTSSSDFDIDRSDIILSLRTSRHLAYATELLGMKTSELEKLLLKQELLISQNNKRRNIIITKNCNLNEVKCRKDSLTKLLYSSLFYWLVEKINENLNKLLSETQDNTHDMQAYIGLLDMYGFENNASNSLEQLCINYANERLHQIYIDSFLKFTQNDYLIEKIKWTQINFNDNLDLLGTLDKGANCLFNLLNEESSLKRNLRTESKDNTTITSCSAYRLSTKIVNRLRNNNHIKHIQKKQHTELFLIKHYAGDVYYNIDYHVIEKNKDQIPNDLVILLSKTTKNNFLIEILKKFFLLNQHENRKQYTVLKKFKQNLDELIDLIKQTKVNYIKCIKPNDNFNPCQFDRSNVLKQLESSGVLATINLYQLGYTNKYTYQDFLIKYLPILTLKRFKYLKNYKFYSSNIVDKSYMQRLRLYLSKKSITFDDASSIHAVDLIKVAEKVMEKCIAKSEAQDSYQFGQNKLFFKDNVANSLDLFLNFVKLEASIRILKTWKLYKLKENLKLVKDIKTTTFNTIPTINIVYSCPALFYKTNSTGEDILNTSGVDSSSNLSSKYSDCKSYFSGTSLNEFCLSSKCNLDSSEENGNLIQLLHTSESYTIISKRNCFINQENIMTLKDCI